MSDLADKHNYGIDTYLNNMLASRMEPLKNMPGYIDIQTYADLDKDVPENKAADLRIRIPLDMRTEYLASWAPFLIGVERRLIVWFSATGWCR
jgi:hypothetical protein